MSPTYERSRMHYKEPLYRTCHLLHVLILAVITTEDVPPASQQHFNAFWHDFSWEFTPPVLTMMTQFNRATSHTRSKSSYVTAYVHGSCAYATSLLGNLFAQSHNVKKMWKWLRPDILHVNNNTSQPPNHSFITTSRSEINQRTTSEQQWSKVIKTTVNCLPPN